MSTLLTVFSLTSRWHHMTNWPVLSDLTTFGLSTTMALFGAMGPTNVLNSTDANTLKKKRQFVVVQIHIHTRPRRGHTHTQTHNEREEKEKKENK
jgi:hypothetical protein